MLHSYKELIVWQKSIDLGVKVYSITENFPRDEIYGLTSQMRRAAISISSNIAEGRTRGSKLEFIHFLNISHGSCAELESQVYIAKKLSFARSLNFDEIEGNIQEILLMLSVMISKLRNNKA